MKLTPEELKWLSGVLRKMDFFSMCTLGEIEDFVGIAVRKSYDKGRQIIKQGEYGGFFFVIKKGKVSVWAQESGSGKRKITSLGPGEYFGETALVEKQPRNATIVADQSCEIFLFYSGDFIKSRLRRVRIRKKEDTRDIPERPKAEPSKDSYTEKEDDTELDGLFKDFKYGKQ